MQTFLYVEMNTFALTVLFLIFFNIYQRADRYLIEQKLFLALLCSNALILVLDTIMWILDGKTGFLIRETYFLVTALYYCLNPIISMMWSFYANYQIYRDEKRLKKLLVPMLIPVCFNTFLSFLSISGGFLFYIDANNVYHRGKFFYIMAVISYLYLMHTLILIILKQNKIQKHNFIPILVFAFPPFIGGILQSLIYGVSLIWVCMTISILIIFINIQNDQLYTDHLTGLFNRRQLDHYLQQKVENSAADNLQAGIMIDINSFKAINDLYGHSVGDEALEYTANILKKTFRRNDFIARYGGDEFIIIMEIKNRLDLKKAIDRLKETVAQFNSQKITPYTISLSVGYDYLEFKSENPVQEFLKHIDRLMYEDKLTNGHN